MTSLNKKQSEIQWRLPLLNALLSLLNGHNRLTPVPFIPDVARWLWSCDLHGKHEGLYVKLDMGYTGTQDVHCCNYVEPVCAMKDT